MSELNRHDREIIQNFLDNFENNLIFDFAEEMQYENQIGGDDVNNEHYSIRKISSKINEKFRFEYSSYQIKINNIYDNLQNVNFSLLNIFDDFLNKIRNNQTDSIQIEINHPNLKREIYIPLTKASHLSAEMILSEFEKVAQSYSNINVDQELSITVGVKSMLDGGSGKKNYKNFDDFVVKKKSIIKINNDDNLCAFRSIAILIENHKNSEDKMRIRKPNSILQKNKATELAALINFNHDNKASIEDLKELIIKLDEYQLIIVDGENNFDLIIVGDDREKKLFLSYYKQHYQPIISMPAFYEKSYFCNKCLTAYNCSYANHKCNNQFCKACKRRVCIEDKQTTCKNCKTKCNNKFCLERHIQLCRKVIKCKKCQRFKSWNHVCNNEKWCPYCKIAVAKNHFCFIQNIPKTLSDKFNGYIFFDFESMNVNNLHVPNLIVAEKVCVDCLDEQKTSCELCEQVFFYSNNSFCEWLFSQNNCIAIAHNMKGYDGVFLMNYQLNNHTPDKEIPNPILNGTKIMAINFTNFKVLDSYSFMPLPLSELPKTFSLQESKKGFFPHLFNTQENQQYIGPYPDASFYAPDLMKTEKRAEFFDWYNKNRDKEFNLQKELYEYCKSDVEILKLSCLSLRKILINESKIDEKDTGIDPFRNSITLPSYCHELYRKKHMKKDTIGIIPYKGYNYNEKTSKKCIEWLRYVSENEHIYIYHSKNGHERTFQNYKVDGFCEETNTIYEFHGCFYHGCPKCYTPSTFNKVLQSSMSEIYERHKTRIEFLMTQAKVVEIWECEFDKLTELNRNLKIKTELTLKSFINPREALFGGRTNAAKLYYKVKEDEEILYYDFNSLYPWSQKYGVFPIGHPIVQTENFKLIDEIFGIVRCKVTPPQNLLFPVLPYRYNGKLLFPLCLKCVEEKSKNCNHQDRSFEGTWVSLELQKAVSLGYKIDEIYCVWHWDNKEQYNSNSKQGGLFTPYINQFLKIKQEATGYPDRILNEIDEKLKNQMIDDYINDYYEKEGIKLDKDKIKKNSGLKATSKFMLNSHWGKYAQNPDKVQYKIVKTHSELLNIMLDNQFIVKRLEFTDNLCQVFYSINEEQIDTSGFTNVVIASFVTCQARLKLFDVLHKLSDRVLYFDTDSVIFIKRKGEFIPETGDFLGDFKSELDFGEHIVEFASAGPKNYVYKTNKERTKSVVKGITLNYLSSKILNFESIVDIIINDNSKELSVDQFSINRNKKDWTLHSSYNKKMYRIVYDKRFIIGYDTFPYGFII